MQEVETGKLGTQYDKNEQTIVKTKTFRVFGGRMRNCILCHNCGYKSLSSERYYDLNIVLDIIKIGMPEIKELEGRFKYIFPIRRTQGG